MERQRRVRSPTLGPVPDQRAKERTSRDPRRLLLERLRDLEGVDFAEKLDYFLSDFDPAIAALAAEILNREARTKRFAPDPLPEPDFLLGPGRAR
jgi:hypothetical protein